MQKNSFLGITFVAIILFGCEEPSKEASSVSSISCRGIYFERESISGSLKKFNQYELNGQCYTDNVPLSLLEATEDSWNLRGVKCTPQPQFSSRTLIAANNTYNYRNSRIWLDLNAQSGVYRRIVLSEDQHGNPSYSKLQSCFYFREGQGQDAIYGKQILLDSPIDKIVTNQSFNPQEAFKIEESGSNVNMIRWDDSASWDYRMCPYLSVPLGENCVLLQQDGNEFYWPTLTQQQKDDLLFQAYRIGKEFNYTLASKSDFENLWLNISMTRKAIDYSDQKIHPIHNTDTPIFFDQTWMQYIRNERPWMPNVPVPSL